MSGEIICDLPMVKAEYLWIERKDGRSAGNGFHVKFCPTASRSMGQIDVDEIDAQQFAAELEALAALIRARVLRPSDSK
jgi:hypothetical protein